MTNLESLIDDLAKENTAKPSAHRLTHPLQMFGLWALTALVYLGLVFTFYLHPRPDLMAKLTNPIFAAEIVTLAALSLSALFSAAVLSFPDLYQMRTATRLPLILFGLFIIILGLAWMADVPPSPEPEHAMDCLICLTVLSIAPGAMLFYQIRRMASAHPAQAGMTAVLAAFALSALTLRLEESTDSISHLVVWHYVPMLIAIMAGIWLGKKIFRW